MRAMIWIVSCLALLYSGYWFIGARAVETAANDFFTVQTGQGLVAERQSLSVQGFPNRFDLTVQGLHLANPVTGIGWRAPFLQLFSLSYKPWHLVAALPPESTLESAFETITLTHPQTQGSLVLVPGADLALDRITVVGQDLRAASTLGWALSAATLRFATEQDSSPNSHRIGVALHGLSPDPRLMAAIAGASTLPDVIESVQFDATAGFSAPLDRHLAETLPRLTRLDVKDAAIRWGRMTGFAKGALTINASGQPEGRLALRVENWRAFMPAAVAMGLVTPEVAPTVERMIELLSLQSGNDPDVLDMPLDFQNGQMRLGPVPLGPAPRLN